MYRYKYNTFEPTLVFQYKISKITEDTVYSQDCGCDLSRRTPESSNRKRSQNISYNMLAAVLLASRPPGWQKSRQSDNNALEHVHRLGSISNLITWHLPCNFLVAAIAIYTCGRTFRTYPKHTNYLQQNAQKLLINRQTTHLKLCSIPRWLPYTARTVQQ